MINLKRIFDTIGIIAPFILFTLSAFFLRNYKSHLAFYIIGFFLNIVLNSILKILIKEPRPKDDKQFIEIFSRNGVRFAPDSYGMPSGHAQTCGFSLIYLALVLNNPNITMFYAIITFISLIQRYTHNNHTILQLIVGLLIGMVVGYLFYFLSKKYIFGKLSHKKDDNFLSTYL